MHQARGAASPVVAAAIVTLVVLAVAYSVTIARPFLVPVTFSLLGSLALAPIKDLAWRYRIPPAVSAALIVTLVGVLGGLVIYHASGPAAEWAERLPDYIHAIKEIMRSCI